jgi:TatD DNase family protein
LSKDRPYIDLHTHQIVSELDVVSVYNLMLDKTSDLPEFPFSAGLHPWYAAQLSLEKLSFALDLCASNLHLNAFGETGLDKACNIPFRLQLDVFELHLKKATEHSKPLILHCVKAWDELIEIVAKYPVIKILHGYTGSEELTNRLVKKGFYFSVGEAILKPDSKIGRSIQMIPTSALFLETDTSKFPIQDIYHAAAIALHIGEQELRGCIFENFLRSMGVSSEIKGNS